MLTLQRQEAGVANTGCAYEFHNEVEYLECKSLLLGWAELYLFAHKDLVVIKYVWEEKRNCIADLNRNISSSNPKRQAVVNTISLKLLCIKKPLRENP